MPHKKVRDNFVILGKKKKLKHVFKNISKTRLITMRSQPNCVDVVVVVFVIVIAVVVVVVVVVYYVFVFVDLDVNCVV